MISGASCPIIWPVEIFLEYKHKKRSGHGRSAWQLSHWLQAELFTNNFQCSKRAKEKKYCPLDGLCKTHVSGLNSSANLFVFGSDWEISTQKFIGPKNRSRSAADWYMGAIHTIPLVYLTNFGQNAIKMEIESSPSFVSMERKLNIMSPPLVPPPLLPITR